MNIAKTIRIRKEREAQMPLGAPRSYCRAPDCLYRIWRRDRYIECPRHPGLNPEVSEAEHGTARQSAASEGTRSQEGAPAVRSLAWHDHPKDCPKACCNPAF